MGLMLSGAAVVVVLVLFFLRIDADLKEKTDE